MIPAWFCHYSARINIFYSTTFRFLSTKALVYKQDYQTTFLKSFDLIMWFTMNLTAQIDNEADYPLIQQNIQRKVWMSWLIWFGPGGLKNKTFCLWKRFFSHFVRNSSKNGSFFHFFIWLKNIFYLYFPNFRMKWDVSNNISQAKCSISRPPRKYNALIPKL